MVASLLLRQPDRIPENFGRVDMFNDPMLNGLCLLEGKCRDCTRRASSLSPSPSKERTERQWFTGKGHRGSAQQSARGTTTQQKGGPRERSCVSETAPWSEHGPRPYEQHVRRARHGATKSRAKGPPYSAAECRATTRGDRQHNNTDDDTSHEVFTEPEPSHHAAWHCMAHRGEGSARRARAHRSAATAPSSRRPSVTLIGATGE